MAMMTLPPKASPDSANLPVASYQPQGVAGPVMVSVPQEPAALGDYLQILARRWPLLLWGALAGCLLGLFLTLVQTPSYRAKTTIEIQNINGDFLNMKQVHPVADEAQGVDALMDLQTQIEVIQSASLTNSAKAAMRRMGLKRSWAARPSAAGQALGTRANLLNDNVLDALADSVKVHSIGQTRLIQVQVDAPNPLLAADFANTLITEYVHENIRARSQMTEAAEDATRAQVVDMRRKLETSEQALQQYAAKYGLVFTSDRQTISDDRLRQVQGDLLHARTDLIERQARRQLAQTAKAESLADVEKDNDLRELRSKLVDLRRQEAELLTVYKPTYSEVLKIRAQADQIEKALTQARERIVNRVMDEYRESSDKEKMLTSAYQEAMAKATTESEVAVQYDILKREADANLTAYQDMLSKVKELALAAAFRTSNVRVVDPAEAPAKRRTPQMPLNVALGLLSGLGLSIGYVLISERSNPTLRHPGEATLRLGIPELAAIPKLQPRLSRLTLPAPNNNAEHQGLSVIHDAGMADEVPTADAFRTLLTSIMFADTVEQPKVIVITSTAAQDGKSTVSSNLAIALARAGKRVLLIDGDLRNPTLHRRFSLPNMIGLGNLLQAGCDATDAQFAVLQTSVTRLSVLPSGSFTAAPADLLFQPNLQALMDSYRDHYDMIVVDSPPVIGLPDARLLGRAADGVVLVARANKTARSALMAACHRFAQDRSRLLGVVLNDWDGQDSPYPS